MTYIKKDGSLKKYYMEAARMILTATKKHTEVMVGRHEKISNSYDCMAITIPQSLTPKEARSLSNKIIEICNSFGYKTHCWYSVSRVSTLEILSLDITKMKNELEKLLN